MKLILGLLLFIGNVLFSNAQVFQKETIKYSGNNDKRINLVILSDGYQDSELDKFITDATNFTNTMFSVSPFQEYAAYFNVYAVKVPSNESGADHPGTGSTYHETNWPVPTTTVDTYFNATFDSYGNHFLLFYEIDGNYENNTEAKIISALADNVPDYDQALILVNSPYYGGSGGKFAMASTGTSSSQIAIHEIGHSLFDLKDEYYPGDELAAEAINMTQETNTSTVKWKHWIGTNNVGIHQHGTSGVSATWYKPRNEGCKMELLNQTFCSVCKEGIIEKIHDLVLPIDAFTPNNNTVNNPTFPLDFQLTLVKPAPNTLKSEWTLNASTFANDIDEVSLTKENLVEGVNTLSVIIHDETTLLKVDNHESIHIDTVTWTINYSTLGIENLESQSDTFNISFYPNPTNSIINLKFESRNTKTLKINIVGMDGKRVKSSELTNFVDNQIDISNLSTGIYLIHFYAENVLIASKKIVKHN